MDIDPKTSECALSCAKREAEEDLQAARALETGRQHDFCQGCSVGRSEPPRCKGNPEVPKRKGWCSQERELGRQSLDEAAKSYDDNWFATVLQELKSQDYIYSSDILSRISEVDARKVVSRNLQATMLKRGCEIVWNTARRDGRFKVQGNSMCHVYRKKAETTCLSKMSEA